MPPVPRHLKLGPHRFRIDSDSHTAVLLQDEGGSWRQPTGPAPHPRLDTNRPHSAVAETLVHEAMHCAWQLTSLRSIHDVDDEEAVVTALAPLMLELLQRNPKLVRYLLS